MIGSKVGFGTNRLTCPPISSCVCVPSCTGRHAARPELPVEVAGEGVERLVVVVVGVDRLEVHGPPSRSCENNSFQNCM